MVKFVGSFPDTDANMIPNIPASYATSAMRVTIAP